MYSQINPNTLLLFTYQLEKKSPLNNIETKLKAPILCSFSGVYFFFRVSTIKCLHPAMFKKHIIFLILPVAAAPLLTLCLNIGLIGQLLQA